MNKIQVYYNPVAELYSSTNDEKRRKIRAEMVRKRKYNFFSGDFYGFPPTPP